MTGDAAVDIELSTEDSSRAASPVPEFTPPPVVTGSKPSDDVGLITEDSSSLGLLLVSTG